MATVELIIDSGATTTIGEPPLFIKSSLYPCHTVVVCANKQKMICKQRGTMLVTYKGKKLEVHDALCMPNVKNLLSVDQLVRMGYIIVFDKGAVGLYASYEDIALKSPFMSLERKIGDKLWAIEQSLKPYVQSTDLHSDINTKSKKGRKLLALLTQTLSTVYLMILHLRFAHASLPTLKIMFPKPLENADKLPHCDAC